ncbi:NAD-dependent aldehyde dehydrogenase protein (plasmid) [Caballeronia insecticola]|uniref:NAD-dependent aldehyde dehydrogenase protein n=2 Tax=Caballeronia insecticola TaxID=758793 RepID=R4X1G5_9BURK|nr:NAD-dependent aldehyde dehydrogenase protein [Caballeronia insecticola]
MRTHSRLFINGEWVQATGDRYTDLFDPSSGAVSGRLIHASKADLVAAVETSRAGYSAWRNRSGVGRCKHMREAANLLRERSLEIASLLTREQGKPRRESGIEVAVSADLLDWFAEEGQRAYGRLIPARSPGITQSVLREPVGPVAAFSPWNFPISQTLRKIAPALAAGCSVVVNPPEETPAATSVLAEIFRDASFPPGVVNIVYGPLSEVSEYLISHTAIRQVTFTGPAREGKPIAALAGMHMKRCMLELGGHAPTLIFDDADMEMAARLLTFAKFRHSGQVCTSPTRFLVQAGVYEAFKSRFVNAAKQIRVGNGKDADVTMGPMLSARRLQEVEDLIRDATEKGARIETGGERLGKVGNFLAPTILSGVTPEMRIMNEELYGPVALLMAFDSTEDAIREANRLSFGLASYAFTRSAITAQRLTSELEVGMLSINHLGFALPETPFSGVKDSGYGSDGGAEAVDSFLTTKFVTHANA